MFGIVGSDDFHPDADNGPLIKRVGAAMMCISALAVILRMLSRRLAKQAFKWDDWLILVATAWAWSVCIVQFIAVDIGKYGQHVIPHATPESAKNFFKELYVDQIVYLLAIAFIKFSILAFYRRIFSVPSTKLPAYIIAGIVLAWLIANILVGVFSCIPIHAFWDRLQKPPIPATCVNTVKYFFGVAIPNITTDVFLIIFPLPLIWKLHMGKSQKVALSGIFTLGGFIVVISSLRLVTVLQADEKDFTWSFLPLGIWNAVETNVGILLACLPSMQPILRICLGMRPTKTGARHTASGDSNHSWFKRTATSKTDGSFTRLHTSQKSDADDAALVYSPAPMHTVETRVRASPMELQDLAMPKHGINVKSDTRWETHRGQTTY